MLPADAPDDDAVDEYDDNDLRNIALTMKMIMMMTVVMVMMTAHAVS
jgi:hypothetical protein